MTITATTTTDRDFLHVELTHLRREALDAARAIEDDVKRAEALFVVAFLTPASSRGPIFDEAIDAADKITDPSQRVSILASMLTISFAKGTGKAWDASAERLLARILGSLGDLDQLDRIKVSVGIISVLPVVHRLALIERVAAEIRTIVDPAERASSLATLISRAARQDQGKSV